MTRERGLSPSRANQEGRRRPGGQGGRQGASACDRWTRGRHIDPRFYNLHLIHHPHLPTRRPTSSFRRFPFRSLYLFFRRLRGPPVLRRSPPLLWLQCGAKLRIWCRLFEIKLNREACRIENNIIRRRRLKFNLELLHGTIEGQESIRNEKRIK